MERVAKSIDKKVVELKKLKLPAERFDAVLEIVAKLSVEIDACYEMLETEKNSVKELTDKVKNLTQEMRKIKGQE